MARTSVLVFVALCWLLVLCFVTTVVAQEVDPDFIAGVKKFDGGEFKGAIDDFAKVTAAKPDFEPAWYYLGVSKFRDADFAGALEALTKASALNPSRTGTRLYIGQIYEAQGAFDEAIRAYQEELRARRGRDEADVFNALGRAYLMVGDYDNAKDIIQRAIDAQPNYVESLFDLGLVYYKLKDNKQAIKQFMRARNVLDEYDQLKARLERLSASEQRAKKATEETMAQQYGLAEQFVTELGLRPALNKAVGDAYLADGDWANARNAYAHALRPSEGGNPADPDVYTRVAGATRQEAQETFYKNNLLFTAAQLASAAERKYEEALKNDANFAQALNGLGQTYAFEAATYGTDPDRGVVSHTFDDAIAKFQAALKSNPNYVDALLNLGRAYLTMGDKQGPGSAEAQDAYNKARESLDKALALQPKSAPILAELARNQVALEQYDDALRTAQTALALDKSNVVAMNAAGMVHYTRGELSDAANYFSDAILADPTKAQSYTNLGNTYFQMASWYRARLEYRNALQRTPEATVARTSAQRSYLYYLIGITHFETGAYQKAVDSFNQSLSLAPAYFAALRALARGHAALKNYRAAERALRIALQKPPDDKSAADVECQLGEMYEEEGKTHEAIAAFSAGLAFDQSNVRCQEGLQRIHAR